eukprot:UN25582
MAIGHLDGSIQVFDVVDMNEKMVFQGHKSAVTTLRFDADSSRLVSGSNDTDVVLWDIIGQEGIVRLRGHTNAITNVQFLNDYKPIKKMKLNPDEKKKLKTTIIKNQK